MNKEQLEIAKQIVSAISSDYYLEQASKMFEYEELGEEYDIDLRFLCHVSKSFEELWLNNTNVIMKIANKYLEETNSKDKFAIGFSVLFYAHVESTLQKAITIRYNFLLWLEEKIN